MSKQTDFPVIEAGQPAPGYFIPNADGMTSKWHGPMVWIVKRGDCLLHMRLGKPYLATNVRLPDGSRRDIEYVGMDTKNSGWRYATEDGRYVLGYIVSPPDGDYEFCPFPEQPTMSPPRLEEGSSMERDMKMSREFLLRLQDDSFAQAVYAAMCNVRWVKRDIMDKPWGRSWRSAAGLVADMRMKGECYMDFYCSGIDSDGKTTREGQVRDDVRTVLAGLGWQPVEGEIETFFVKRAEEILQKWEAREGNRELSERVFGKGQKPYPEDLRNPLLNRAYTAHNNHKVWDKREWQEFFELLP
jgi:hypothetical protein